MIGVLFIIAGVNNFLRADFYTKIMPSYLSAHLSLVYLSGFFEVLGGAGLLINRLRRLAGFGLIAVFPANVDMVIHAQNFPSIPFWALVARLPLQFVLMAGCGGQWTHPMTRLYVESTILSDVWLVANDGCDAYFHERYEPVVFHVPVVSI